MDTFLSSGQDYLLNLMPCTNEGRPLSVVRISVGITNGVSVQGRPLLVLKVLCNLRKAKAKQDLQADALTYPIHLVVTPSARHTELPQGRQ